MKTYRYQPQIGKARHCVSHHDGLKAHKDGSPFFDIEVCGNKRKLGFVLRKLQNQGYTES